MAKKKTKSRKQSRLADRRTRSTVEDEDRRSVAVTVAWMMCTLATAAALALYGIALGLTRQVPIGQRPANTSAMFPGLALFTAVVSGVFVLLLIPLVYRFRQSKPPLAITVSSILVAIAPFVVLLMRIL